jgi:hypothetical protein
MMTEPATAPTQDYNFWFHGLDRNFFRRVHIRSMQIGGAACLISMGLEQRQVALGLLCGLLVGMFSILTAEATVRLLFTGGGFAGFKLLIAAAIKFPVVLFGLTGIAWACVHHYMNAFAVVGGVLLTHTVILVLAVATGMANGDTVRERYR